MEDAGRKLIEGWPWHGLERATEAVDRAETGDEFADTGGIHERQVGEVEQDHRPA